MSSWPVEKYPLTPPSLHELSTTIRDGLKGNFKDVSVEVTTCPDLRKTPYDLAAPGLSGNECIADVGGPPNLRPIPQKDHKYSTPDLMKLMEMKDGGFVLGAGAGPFHVVGVNSELMTNLSYDKNGILDNRTRVAKIVDGDICTCQPLNSTDAALMVNWFGSEGATGDVIKITAKSRTGKLSFTDMIQEALKEKYSQPISLGGVFVIRSGKAHLHVMPDFSKDPVYNQDMPKWLKFFDMSSPLVCLTVFHSRVPGLDLRMEHTHCFSDHDEGGHYHNDTTPEDVEYEAYLNTAKVIYRIDRPLENNTGGAGGTGGAHWSEAHRGKH